MTGIHKEQSSLIETATDLLAMVAERTMRFDFTVWFWGDSIAFDGMFKASEILNVDKFRNHMIEYLKRWVLNGQITWNDVVCPSESLIQVHLITKQHQYLEMAERLANHLNNEVPRSYKPEGPIYLPDNPRFRNFIWVDSLYHLPTFFFSLARITNKTVYIDWGMYVIRTHINCLQDKETLLFPQGRDLSNSLIRGFGWGRGVAWAHLGLIDAYALLPEDHPERSYILEKFEELSKVILNYQDSTGCWRNLIHRSDAPLEGSTAAMFGAAFEKGVRLGVLGDEYEQAANLAWGYVCKHINDEGGFYNASACSWSADSPGDDSDRYMRFYTEVNVWGQGAALRIITERILSGKEFI